MLEELLVEVTDCSNVVFLDADRTSTPAWLIRLACAAHAAAASLAECRDLCEWFGVSRTRAAIHHWYQSYADHYDQDFTADPDRIAVDEKQIQLAEEENVWLYAAIDADSKVVLLVIRTTFASRGIGRSTLLRSSRAQSIARIDR